MVAVAIVGILAAVAIPAFQKNARKAKTTEAVTLIKRIYDGARSYYHEESNGRGLIAPIARQFPSTPAANNPAPTACCGQPGWKCSPDPNLWEDPSWQALKFSVDDPGYYEYGYSGSGTSGASAFTASAHGDLDCNSTFSTFEIVGSVDALGNVTGQAGIFRDHELE